MSQTKMIPLAFDFSAATTAPGTCVVSIDDVAFRPAAIRVVDLFLEAGGTDVADILSGILMSRLFTGGPTIDGFVCVVDLGDANVTVPRQAQPEIKFLDSERPTIRGAYKFEIKQADGTVNTTINDATLTGYLIVEFVR
jgi:hypothetical protein